MDLSSNDPIYSDIEEMEKGVYRCRDIIENLLNFSRDPSIDKTTEFNLFEAIQRAIKILELQTKSKGIEIKLAGFSTPIPFKGNFNLLSEAFRNVLQNCIESVVQKQTATKSSRGEISLQLSMTSDNLVISITDNGLGAVSSSTLTQSIATQIIRDHKGEVHFNQIGPEGMTTKVSLPRLVF
jgi:nitrogen fixation/metabolism regulation signal transduction histidine kinase